MAQIHVHRLACMLALMAVTLAKKEQTRWSRQINSYTSGLSDWVPLSGPIEKELNPPPHIKRQTVAEPRILTETYPGVSIPTGFNQEALPSRGFYNSPANRQLYLQSMPAVPSAPQNYLTDQGFGQGIRFGLSQPNFPLSQGFVAPEFTFDSVPQVKTRLQAKHSSPIDFENFQKTGLSVSPQTKPFVNQQPKVKAEAPKFVDGYRAENASNEFGYTQKKKPQSLQKIKFDNFGNAPKIQTIPQGAPKVEREEVQLLYVPLESLNRGQFNFRSPLTTSQLINTDSYTQGLPRPNPLKQTLTDYQRPKTKPLESFSDHDYFTNFNSQLKDLDQVPQFSTVTTPFPTVPSTTPKAKKLKPHQPPLAIFLTREASKNNQIKVGDVLSSLKSADTIAVLDSVNPLNAPKVFIGPSTLTPPENYIKFELPYLSNIENSDKLKQLPFFVAPLSYNTPQGFAKIPFPSPHVGSVVINSQIKETQTTQPFVPNVKPNSYSATSQTYRQEKIPVTQKPTISFYSTAPPRPNPQPHYPSNYYSIEPQMVSSHRPLKETETATAPPKLENYYMNNPPTQYNSRQYNSPLYNSPLYNSPQYNSQYVNFPQNDNKAPAPNRPFNNPKQTEATTTTPKSTTTTPTSTTTTPTSTTTVTTTSIKLPSTYPSHLLETHNPYSINQAFHFSTPLDYQNFFDEVKEPIANPESEKLKPSSLIQPPSSSIPPPRVEEVVTEKQRIQHQSSPNYLQTYSPEIHYESEVQNSRYPVFNKNDYTTKPDVSSELSHAANPVNINNNILVSSVNPTEYSDSLESQSPVSHENQTEIVNHFPTQPEDESTPYYNLSQYETNYNPEESITSSTTSTTTSTTRRTPIRSRGRPRYTTQGADANESTSRATITRRPLKERRPLPPRPRYEPNKITMERTTRKPTESNENTTKPSRTRTRGRVQYRPAENDEIYDRRVKSHNSKEEDLAYQRDILHQNYPVTLMERTSTVDVEAITDPAPKISSIIKNEPITETFDTENAYTNEEASIIKHDMDLKEDIYIPRYTSRTTVQTETPYVPKLPSTHNEEYVYQLRSSTAPVDATLYEETAADKEESYPKQTTLVQHVEPTETISYSTEPLSSVDEQDIPVYSINDDLSPVKQDETTTLHDIDFTKSAPQEVNQEVEEDEEIENIVQTTPSYNRVRVRPGVIRQYHQASTESSRNKERRRPGQSVTYRPAYDRRRTTMRIDEIEADLKTKQVHTRPEVEVYKHPVYKPEPTTEPSLFQSTQESATKRGHYRRRRPTNSYSTTSTEGSVTRRTYEVKNRFRGRRPTEKPEMQTETSTSTTRNPIYTRYSHKPRLSERYNKKPESEEIEDQDLNYSISRPKYAEPESGVWSPKISSDSFKPFNPNDIVDDKKLATTEHKSDKDSELEIITARNEYDDILISVTPAYNNRNNKNNKKIPEIPPTLEALVEQSKVSKSDSTDSMSTFESMLEEVMKSLEEQDEDEYTSNVMKHKGGEIGEIPPEKIISNGDTYSQKSTTPTQEVTTVETIVDDLTLLNEEQNDRKSRRRGFWKKVKVHPITTESIEFAESQYYTSTVNRLGQPVKSTKITHDKMGKSNRKIAATTYKPTFKFIKDFFGTEDETLPNVDVIPTVDIPKISNKIFQENKTENIDEKQTTATEKESQTENVNYSPGDLDLGTGSPDPTIDDLYYTTPTPIELTSTKTTKIDRSDGYSFMDYLFGVTSEDIEAQGASEKRNETLLSEPEITTETKSKIVTTESTYIPEEITTEIDGNTVLGDPKKEDSTEKPSEPPKGEEHINETTESVVKVETSSVSSFMNLANVVSTSMSTEVSHETEICFRGKCIKTNRNIL